MTSRALFLCIFVGLLLAGCAGPPVKESVYVGECKELQIPHDLIRLRANPTFSSELMLTPKAETHVLGLGVTGKTVPAIGRLPEGTRVVIHQVIGPPRFFPFPGQTLRVMVRILEGEFAGLIADVLACVPGHPREWWVTTCTLEPDDLRFDPEVVRPCEL